MKKHSVERTSTYIIWANMIQRCSNPKNPSFKNYGGRGIFADDSWKVFDNFLNDMGERPQGRELNRINNDGPYSPENCEWASKIKNARNKRTTAWYEHNGVKQSLMDWSESPYCKVSYTTLRKRIRDGWQFSDALVTEKQRPHQRKTHCVNGHEFVEENIVVYSGNNVCKICHRERGRRSWRKSRGQ